MIATWALLLSLTALATCAGLFVLMHRASNARRELAQSQHDRALALDLRCDDLQRQLHSVEQRHRITDLLHLVSLNERHQRLDSDVARRLQHYVLALSDEARSAGEAR